MEEKYIGEHTSIPADKYIECTEGNTSVTTPDGKWKGASRTCADFAVCFTEPGKVEPDKSGA